MDVVLVVCEVVLVPCKLHSVLVDSVACLYHCSLHVANLCVAFHKLVVHKFCQFVKFNVSFAHLLLQVRHFLPSGEGSSLW